ncbi:MAG: hypothetical protein ACFE94_02065 [Candidatus Hodarchaeota archaeon]
MGVTKLSNSTDITPVEDSAKIRFVCPVCKSEKVLYFPKSVITQSKGLSTMSIASGLVCEHQFQAFVDKNYVVRGYQRVDFEFEKIKVEERKVQTRKEKRNDDELFENLILEGDYLEYNPKRKEDNDNQNIHALKENENHLEKIYNEFWEFIDEENSLFQKFIKDDIRRGYSSKFNVVK